MGRRRAGALLLAAAVAGALLTALTGCTTDFPGLRLRIAAGNVGGVYYELATPLATAWAADLGIPTPEVQQTMGSPDNLERLQNGTADVAFCAADIAASARGPKLMALARIYDDYLHVVVRDDSPIRDVAGLRGKRVAIGSPESGVEVIATKLLSVAGLAGALTTTNLGLDDSLAALADHRVDAVFWSGGLPTGAIGTLDARVPLRLLDLSAQMPAMRHADAVYRTATIPASTYHQPAPVTTLSVPNYLVVSASMPDDVAEALARGLFTAQPALVRANPAALSIDIRSAIETSPLDLHPGAVAYYRSQKE